MGRHGNPSVLMVGAENSIFTETVGGRHPCADTPLIPFPWELNTNRTAPCKQRTKLLNKTFTALLKNKHSQPVPFNRCERYFVA